MLQTLGILLALAGPQQPAAPEPAALPEAIRAYYDDHNFVVAFSRSHERQMIVSRSREGRSPSDPRLLAVRERMGRLIQRIEPLDPGILAPQSADIPDIARDTTLLEIRAQDVDEDAGLARVDLDAIALESPGNMLMIAEFARLSSGPLPNPIDLALQFSGRLRIAEATHRWQRVRGEWRREAATQVLIVR